MSGVPVAEVHVPVEMVRALLAEQHPQLAQLEVEPIAEGWDNYTFRLGRDLAIRMPRRQLAAELVLHEQTWLPVLQPRLSLAVPAPVHLGQPGCGFPWHWSVVPWFDGDCADTLELDVGAARAWAKFLRELHSPAPENAPRNPFRGVPLDARKRIVDERLETLRELGPWITDAIGNAWREALAAPPSAARVWLHGDLHGLNVLGRENRLRAVIDWGDITAGDPATDLASVWMLFDSREARRAFADGYGATDALLARARGWAVAFGSVLLESGMKDSPRHAEIGAATLRRLAEDA